MKYIFLRLSKELGSMIYKKMIVVGWRRLIKGKIA
jgi:hypothetical protein